ncbi:hypothetical protein KQX54_014442 [Cotesia glomerata]|uniref:Uncharacterized protein n=1 Tax=Cotesia glomerata TaxID=32391 RepID=A0AAV7I2Z0_COTGL|nr:hypothetical protein KQX54_014442 [Cotesia glomerata]
MQNKKASREILRLGRPKKEGGTASGEIMYNTRSKLKRSQSQTDIRTFTMSQESTKTKLNIEKNNAEKSHEEESDKEDDLDITIVNNGDFDLNDDTGKFDGVEDEDKKRRDKEKNSQVTKTTQEARNEEELNVLTTDGVNYQKLTDEIEELEESMKELINNENKKMELNWQLMLSQSVDEIRNEMKHNINTLINELKGQREKTPEEKNQKVCSDCANRREKEARMKQEMKDERRKWDDEREKLSKRCLLAEEELRKLENKARDKERNKDATTGRIERRLPYRNEDYVLRTDMRLNWNEERAPQIQGQNRNINRKVRNEKEERTNNNEVPEPQKPRPLNEEEFQQEMVLRNLKKNNLIVRHNYGSNLEAMIILQAKLNKKFDSRNAGPSGDKWISLRFRTHSEKIEVMKGRWNLKGTGIFLDDDETERQAEIAKWLRELSKKERQKGAMTKLGYMKICINYEWYYWDEKRGLTNDGGTEI